MEFRPKKRLGQNFLHDSGIASRIVDAAKLAPDATVIELGAGRGILTRPLAARGVRLIAIELDRELHTELVALFAAENKTTRGPAGPVEIVQADFTKLTITGLLAARGLERCVLFGNIPYHLTRDVLFSFLVDEHEMIEAAYLMLQREVGERIVSPPGSRVYGITSVVLQSLYDTRPLFRVGPGAFYPRPKVDSIVVEFKPLVETLIEPAELNGFVSLVKNLFQQRRKTIHNTLKRFYSLSETELGEVSSRTGVSLDKRPEELGKKAFLELSRTVSSMTTAG
jgi:16S rRNA (adenine1518-N6/adenine1519-N6)-dimethyltransferase